MNINAVTSYNSYRVNSNITTNFGVNKNNFKARKEALKNKIIDMQKHGDNSTGNLKELMALVEPENIAFAEKMLKAHNNANTLHHRLIEMNTPSKELNLARIKTAEAMLDSGKFEPFRHAATNFETVMRVVRNDNDAENVKKLCKAKDLTRHDIAIFASTKTMDAAVAILNNTHLTKNGKKIILESIKKVTFDETIISC